MAIVLLIMAFMILIAALATIASIGKPRGPLQPSDAVRVTLINAAWIVVLILAALRIGL